MAKGYVKVDASNLKEMLARFSEVTGKSMPQIVRAHARVCAVELANRTQPFTGGGKNGPVVLARGVENLKKDILKPVKDSQKLQAKADGLRNEKLRVRMQAVVNSGNNQAIAALLAAVKTIVSPSNYNAVNGVGDIKTIHRSRRSKTTGHSLSASPNYNYAKSGVDSYVKQAAKMIGYAKSGWAECARKIGGVKGDGARGIPAFAKRQKAGNFDVSDNSERKNEPHFTMTNTTPWVSRLINSTAQREATYVARGKMIKAMNRVFAYVAKNGKDVESITAATVANAE